MSVHYILNEALGSRLACGAKLQDKRCVARPVTLQPSNVTCSKCRAALKRAGHGGQLSPSLARDGVSEGPFTVAGPAGIVSVPDDETCPICHRIYCDHTPAQRRAKDPNDAFAASVLGPPAPAPQGYLGRCHPYEPHVFVPGALGGCLMCDRHITHPLHVTSHEVKDGKGIVLATFADRKLADAVTRAREHTLNHTLLAYAPPALSIDNFLAALARVLKGETL